MEAPKTLLKNPVRHYPAGNMVLFQGEAPRQAFYVKSGAIKLYAIDDSGSERVVGFASEGDIFPMDWLLNSSTSALFYHETLTNAELVPIDKATFTNLVDSDKSVSSFVLDYVGHVNAKQLLRHLALQQSSAVHKLLFFLYFLSVRHGKEVSAGILNPGLPLTHQLLADNLGLTRETVAMEMSALKKRGVLMYKRKRYLIDKKLLITTVGKDISSSFET